MTSLYAALFGLAFGSFVNAAIDRIPRGRSLNGRSACDACGRTLRAWELVPVLSFLLLRGRCSTCHAAISARTPLIELATGAAFAAMFGALAAPAAIAACAVFVAAAITAGIMIEKRGVQR
jgi:leader peptidase (prepilin peptidase)/N-methyltransferase